MTGTMYRVPRRLTFAGAVMALLGLSGIYEGSDVAAEVYRGEHISVNAGIIGLEEQIVQFGDVLSFEVRISHDPAHTRIEDLDARFFSDAWPQSSGVYLLEQRGSPQPETGDFQESMRWVYNFQILACPDGEAICRGTRHYELPEFSLRYQLVDGAGKEAATETIRFRPSPSSLLVSSALPLGKEEELYPFSRYFPTGAYPGPLSGPDQNRASIGLVSGGVIALLGGILMSPFSSVRGRLTRDRAIPRWEQVLMQLQSGEFKGEEQFLDGVRRCLVWYCVGVLAVDPFDWLWDGSDEAGRTKSSGNFAEHRRLFMDLLHYSDRDRERLLERLSILVPTPAGASGELAGSEIRAGHTSVSGSGVRGCSQN